MIYLQRVGKLIEKLKTEISDKEELMQQVKCVEEYHELKGEVRAMKKVLKYLNKIFGDLV